MHIVETLKAIKRTLTADAGAGGVNTLLTGRIHNFEAPQETAFPYLEYELTSGGGEDSVLGRVNLRMQLEFLIVHNFGKSFEDAMTVADRIIFLLCAAASTTERVLDFSTSGRTVSQLIFEGFSQETGGERPAVRLQFSLTVDQAVV